MSARRSGHLLCLVLASVGFVLATAAVADAAPQATGDYYKYYTVSKAYQGHPENLTEVAQRFLGDGSRSTDIFTLNAGRPQPAGATLTDASTSLRAGWYLVLPWDAVGTGLAYGPLPTQPPATQPAPTAPAIPQQTAPGHPASQSPGARTAPTKQPGGCPPLAATSTSRSDWAQQRVAADQAWPRTRGKGVTVAIVDSGVDASLQQLSGRVTVGADIVTGTGRADTDCLGTGTAMASLIIAQGGAGDLNGTAPDATVMPVRVVTAAGASRAADEATAIQVAVSAGARVIALGSYVDMTDPAVAAAIGTATGHDVLVVGCAPTATAAPAATRNQSTLQVGGVDTNNNLAAHYQPGSVDVVAPSVNVLTLGVSGTGQLAASGTQYAVAFVAGEAALIRAASPALTAAQVAQRVKSTADAAGQTRPNATDGWGFINPTTAVDLPLAPGTSNQADATPAASSGGRSGAALAILGLVGLAVTLLIGWRVRRTLRNTDEPDDPDLADEPEPQLPSAPTTRIPGQPANR